MSLQVLKYIASKGGKVDVRDIEAAKTELDNDLHFYSTHTVDDALTDLYREDLAKGISGAVSGEVELTEKGKKVAEILLKK